MNKKAYLKNVLDFHKEGLSLDDAINKAIAVEYIGRKLVNQLGQDEKQVCQFIKIVNNYINLKYLYF